MSEQVPDCTNAIGTVLVVPGGMLESSQRVRSSPTANHAQYVTPIREDRALACKVKVPETTAWLNDGSAAGRNASLIKCDSDTQVLESDSS